MSNHTHIPSQKDTEASQEVEGGQPARFFADNAPAGPGPRSHIREWLNVTLDSKGVRDYSTQSQTSPFEVFVAAFRALHFLLTGVEDASIRAVDICCGTQDVDAATKMKSFFPRLLIRQDSFQDLVQSVARTHEHAQDLAGITSDQSGTGSFPHLPTATLVYVSGSKHDSLDQTLLHIDDLLRPLRDNGGSDIELFIFEDNDGFSGRITYDEDRHDESSAANMAMVLSLFLPKCFSRPTESISSLSFREPKSMPHEQGLETGYLRDLSVVDGFREAVESWPERTAVVDSSSQLTYQELDQQSDIVAGWLLRSGHTRGSLIAVIAGRSCQTVAAFIGILKLDMAYVPLDPSLPLQRVETILSSISNLCLVLLGSDVDLATSSSSSYEWKPTITIDEVFRNGSIATIPPELRPAPKSLAYIIFTSGSTGRPKGVMVEHRGIVRLVKGMNAVSKGQDQHGVATNPSFAHMASIAFDASTLEIYTALLSGVRLVCIDDATVFDLKKLGQAFREHHIRQAFVPTALLHECLEQHPDALAALDTVYAGGERMDPEAARRAARIVPNMFNVYGPTENTVLSTIYRMHEKDHHANGVPIGEPLPHNAAYIMGARQQLLPLGLVGELVLTGEGVARGYTDAARDTDRFVEIEIDGRMVRAYRTGDSTRYRPRDYQLEYLGRIDNQVKIRGFRVELEEVERALSSLPTIRQAAALAVRPESGDQHIVSFVTLNDQISGQGQGREERRAGQEEDQAQSWKELYDGSIYLDLQTVDQELLGRDFTGWTSMYTGELIDREEMNEWLDDTVRTITNGKGPANVLEIGTGSGMILFNLMAGLETYTGLEPSEEAVSFVTSRLKALHTAADNFRVHLKTVADLKSMSPAQMPSSPYTVVFNSVVQYFPSQDYLMDAIREIFHLEGAEYIYFGDIRSYALYPDFCASRILYKASDTTDKQTFQRRLAAYEETEEELLVDPAFFTALKTKFPSHVYHVEIVPKRMKTTNELSSYRYAAVVHLKTGRQPPLIHRIPSEAWSDFTEEGLDYEQLRKLLLLSSRNTTGAVIQAFKNIPNSNTNQPRHVLASLRDTSTDASNWLQEAKQAAVADESKTFSAYDLHQIASEAGCCVEISWSRQYSQRGGFDAVFYASEPSDKRQRMLFDFPHEDISGSARRLTTQPVHVEVDRSAETQLLETLRSQLPNYMVPSIIEIIDHFPMSHTGKVDRRALSSNAELLLSQRTSSSTAAAPRTDAELALCEEFCFVLGVKGVGIYDNFLELGGHSLMAMRLVSRVNKRLGAASLTVADVLSCPVVEDLALRLGPFLGEYQEHAIPRLQHTAPVALSYAQGRLWFLDQLYPSSTGYIVPLAVPLRGHLNLAALEAALQAIESRHESLRTTFSGVDDDRAVQHVSEFTPSVLRIVNMSAHGSDLQVLLDQEQGRPFDLEREAGWRVAVFRRSDDDHVLSIVMHHIISDGWSVDILCRELNDFYSAALRGGDLPSLKSPLPVQYRDYAVWEQNPTPQEVHRHQQQLNYWLRQLEGSQAAELTPDKPRPELLAGKAGTEGVVIDSSLYSDLQEFSTKHNVTPYVALLAAFRASLYRLTGTEDCNIGIANANRSHSELEDLIGFFVNLECIRLPILQDKTFGELLTTTRDTVAAAHDHRDVPFERVIAAMGLDGRDASRNPLVQLTFVLHSQNQFGQIRLEGVEAEETILTSATRFDLEFHLFQDDNRLKGYVLFATSLYHPETIRNLVSVFKEVLRQGMSNPTTPVAGLSLCDNCAPAIQESPAPALDQCSILDLFQQHAASSPSHIAVKDSKSQLSYAELDERSSLVSRWMLFENLPSETVVGVLGNRSCETIITFLGIIKANMAYLPMDANQPWTRVEATLLSVQGDHKYLFVGSDVSIPASNTSEVKFLRVPEILEQQLIRESTNAVPKTPRPTSSSLAYIIFTSGSTGKPKGIMIEHRGIVRIARSFPQLQRGGATAHIASISFDMSSWEIYTSLLNGGTLICIESALDFPKLADTFAAETVRTGMFTPVWVKQCLALCPQVFSSMDLVFIGGEPLNPRDTRHVLKLVDGDVYNVYGPTESTVISTAYRLAKDGSNFTETIPIGEPICNTGALVMDFLQRNLVPSGVLGELLLTGEGLARGYTLAELTQRNFIDVAFGGTRNVVRAYRTGDSVRMRPKDGQLEIFGRIDNQVKVRGYRVELAEVERALSECDEVQSSAAIVYAVGDQERELVAFVTLASKAGQTQTHRTPSEALLNGQIERDLKRALSDRLPPYMVPTTVRILDEMPITRSGKIDRSDLVSQMVQAQDNAIPNTVLQDYAPPRDALESALCEEVGQILKTQAVVGITNSFFKLGGHSLMAVRLISRINKRLGTSIAIKELFDNPVVADLAAIIRPRLGAQTYKSIPHAYHTESEILSYAQTRLWFLEQLSPGSVKYVMPIVFRLVGPLSTNALEAAVNAVSARHDILRTTFEETNGVARQVVHAHRPQAITAVPVRGEMELEELLLQNRNTPFDLESSPGYRLSLYQMDEESHVFCFFMHHIISDGWSLEILCRELAAFYAASLEGRNLQPVLPQLPIQYYDFARWQKEDEQTKARQNQVEYWKQQLDSARVAELLPDYSRPSTTLSGDAGLEEIRIDGSLFQNIQTYCKAKEVTPFMLLLSVFRAAHYRLTGVQDAIIGTANANRNREELEQLIGFFVNLLPLRIKVDGEQETLDSLVQQVKDVVIAAHANQDVPFERIVAALQLEDRDASRAPLVQITFALHAQHGLNQLPLKGTESSPMTKAHTTRFDLEFHLFQEPDVFSGWILYEKDLFDASSVRGMLDVFNGLLQKGLHIPSQSLHSLPLASEPPCVEEVPAPAALGMTYERESSIVQAFQVQVAARPSKIAVKDDTQVLTYAQLDSLSDRMASWLAQHQMDRENWVGVLSGRSCQTVIAFLGILKANMAYLPLDETLPPSRVEKLLSAMPGKRIVLLGPGCSNPPIEMPDCHFEYVDSVLHSPEPQLAQAPPTASSLAYVMFTSGSTGEPKGVMIEHRGIVRMAAVMAQPMSSTEPGGAAHMASISFDMSTWEIYTAILNGYSLVCIDRKTVLDPLKLADAFIDPLLPVRMAVMAPVLLKHILKEFPEAFSSIESLVIAGDRLDPHDARAIMACMGHAKVYNAWGPTENSVISSIHQLRDGEDYVNGVPIGRTVRNSGVYVVDDQMQQVPHGVIGELVVTGDGVARGYTDSSRNAAFQNLYIHNKAVRAYRTGDFGRFRPRDLNLEIFGRKDNQVKIRGHRVEPAEIERALLRCYQVADAAVVAKQQNEQVEVVAFVTLSSKASASISQLTEEDLQVVLRSRLPHFMLPSTIKIIDAMPLNTSGKVDRKALATRTTSSLANGHLPTKVQPRNAFEQALSEEFAAVLDTEVGVTDNFFLLGGHSEMAMRLVASIKKRFKATIGIADLFDCPTVEGLAKRLNTASDTVSAAPFSQDLESLTTELAAALEAKRQTTSPRRVFLTGATGYFGSAILHALLRQDETRRISVLVRASSVQKAVARVISSATIAGWWSSEYLTRIDFWLGDLEQPNLGLSLPHWRTLCGMEDREHCIDAIIHNGAKVDWYSSYDKLRAANVLSTYNLLEVVCTNMFIERFVFVSSGGQIDMEAQTINGRDFRQELLLANGYVQTKLLAEHMMLKISMQGLADNRLAVLKPGFIIGDHVLGVANADDYIWRVVAACVTIGRFPQEPNGSWIQISSHADLANSVLDSLNGSRTFHSRGSIAVPGGSIQTWKFWRAVLNSFPVTTKLVAASLAEWKTEVETRIVSDSRTEHHISAVWPFVRESDLVLGEIIAAPESVVTATEAESRLEEAIGANVKYLSSHGYFDQSWSRAKSGVFTRTAGTL